MERFLEINTFRVRKTTISGTAIISWWVTWNCI